MTLGPDINGLPHKIRDAMRAGRYVRLVLASKWERQPFQGIEGRCHDNASAWCVRHPVYEVVKGYICQGPGRYVPHSVVRDQMGFLLDVTLRPDANEGNLRFVLDADVSDAPFAEIDCVSLSPLECLAEMGDDVAAVTDGEDPEW